MKKFANVKRNFCFLAIFMALGSASYAGEVTSLPGGTVYAMPAVNYFGHGPVVFDGITWTATGGQSVFGYTGTYGFASNGYWDGALGPMAGVNSSTDSMTFAPSSPVSGIGGFLNYAQPGYGIATIAVYNASHVLIEADTVSFSTGGGANSGQFLGFLESTPDIAYFTLTGAYIGLTDLTVQTSAVAPEPSTPLLLGINLFGAALIGLAWKACKSRAFSSACRTSMAV